MMRFPGLALLFFASATAVFAAPQTTTPAPQANQQSANANGVDSIIALVQANMSEGLVLKTIQRQNKAYDLTPDDLLKLQKAGVSERIINAMLDPSTMRPALILHRQRLRPRQPRRHRRPLPRRHPRHPRAASGPRRFRVRVLLIWPHPVQPGRGPLPRARPGSTNAAAGCPQTSSTTTPASGTAAPAQAQAQQQPKGGVFSSFKDRMKGSAQKTVDGFGDTMNCAVDKGVQTSESQVSSQRHEVTEDDLCLAVGAETALRRWAEV